MSNATPVPELQRRLVFSMLRPVVALSRRFGLPLKELLDLARLAYFEELRQRQGASQAEVARVFGTSLRTVGHLERRYRADFLSPSEELERARCVELALVDGPLDVAAIATATGEAPEQVARTLTGLMGAGRVVAQGDEVALDHRFVSLVRDELGFRIDGLNHQLDVVAASVINRFCESATRPGMARTLAFVGSRAGLEGLAAELIQVIRARCSEAEEQALTGDERHMSYAMTFALAPTEPARSTD